MKLVLVSFTPIYSATCALALSLHTNVCISVYMHVLCEALVFVLFQGFVLFITDNTQNHVVKDET